MSEMRYRVVTEEQLGNGYLELYGVVATPKQFEVVRKLEDGNYLVIEPDPKEDR